MIGTLSGKLPPCKAPWVWGDKNPDVVRIFAPDAWLPPGLPSVNAVGERDHSSIDTFRLSEEVGPSRCALGCGCPVPALAAFGSARW